MQTDVNYDKDFHKWSQKQTKLLREGKLDKADIEHIAEEIDSMGKSEKRELVSRLTVLLLHLLKWEYQPGKRSKSRLFSIEEQRDMIIDHLEDNPSLKINMDESRAKAYKYARRKAENETGLDKETFPEDCPYSFEEAMGMDVKF
jgi:hypothetical protein